MPLPTPLLLRRTRFWHTLAASILLVLASCGGGSGSNTTAPPQASVSGLWQDTSSSRNIQAALILGDGTYWAFFPSYSAYAAGFDQGMLSLNSQTAQYEYLNGTSGFNLIHVDARYNSNTIHITGTRTRDANQSQDTFDLTRMTSATSNIQNTRFTGDLMGIAAYTDISNVNGNNQLPFNGYASGCLFSGELTPLSGITAFSAHLTFATNNNCNTWSGVDTNGYAIAYSVPNTGTTRLLIAVRNTDGSKGWLFTATR